MQIALLTTAPPGAAGSMSRYAALVLAALAAEDGCSAETAGLARATEELARVPRLLRSRAHHAAVRKAAGRVTGDPRWDLLHVMDGSHAYVAGGTAPMVVTSHDIIPLLQIKGLLPGPPVRPLARRIIRQSIQGLHRAARVIADSEATREDLIEHTGMMGDRITVIPPPLDPAWLRETADPEPPDKTLILHVGNDAFYKNREGVLRIFQRMRAGSDRPLELVLAGAPPNRGLSQLISELRLEDAVRCVPYPEDEGLRALYRQATLMLFPSLYEGFGWPPLEAMSQGCPVVVSNAASLPEVMGESGLSAPPGDEEQLAALALNVLDDEALANRLAEAGRSRARAFSLERFGHALMDMYRDCLS